MKIIFSLLLLVCFFAVACGEEKSVETVVQAEKQGDKIAASKAMDKAPGAVPQEAAAIPKETAAPEVPGQKPAGEGTAQESHESIEPEEGGIFNAPESQDGFPPPETQEKIPPPPPADEAPEPEPVVSTTAAPPAIVEKPAVLSKCEVCHTFNQGGMNRVGPNLFGIYGSEAGKSKDFQYTNAFLQAFQGKIWDVKNLDAWITDSKNVVPKSKMVTKIPEPVDRAAIINYLKGLK
ncbi:MAG: c-type cytochrome [Nitrospinae bacterium]|nr:c-type cytochrome [Nitrospinota bacterium]